METPLFLTSHSENKKQPEAADRSLPSRGRRPERLVLLDISNDSPIVGLAAGGVKTPSSSLGKCRAYAAVGKGTPASGEALLRGQVKTLLQKIEEEAELLKVVPAASKESAPFRALLGHLRSPAGLLAPTPANTPQLICLSGDKEGPTPKIPSAQREDDSKVLLAAANPKEEETPDAECLIYRALRFDTPEESEISNSCIPLSALSYQGSDFSSCQRRPTTDDDCSSAWSMQVNPGSREDEEEDDAVEEEACEEVGEFDGYYSHEGGEEEEGEGAGAEGLDALCEGMRAMWMDQERKAPEFTGKHTRFTYNSDDEIVGEEEVGVVSPGVLRLRGLPAPEGKHLRFQEEEED